MARDEQALLLQMSADLSKLEKQFAKAQGVVDKGSTAMERRAKAAGTNLERFFGKTDPAKALDKVFDATRFRVLDSGVARIGLMGSALESLGPIGLGAAAAIGAVGIAFAGAREAARFADDINDTANNLHITTDALQEYRYAIRAAGGDEKGADEALASFSETLGKAREGLPKALKGFLALGFTKEQVKSIGDVDTGLKAVTEKFQGLAGVDKDAVVGQLGLTGLKPLVEGGLTAMQALRDEAHKVGIVMDADLVKRGGELNDQFETTSKVIDVQIKSALVDLGPVLVDLLKLMADLARDAADVADAFRSIENKRTDRLKDLREGFVAQTKGPLSAIYGDNARKKIGEIDTELAKRAATDKAPPLRPTKTLVNQGPKAPAGPRDDTAQKTEAVNATLAGAAKDLLSAQLALTDNVEERAKIEREIADQELAQATARLEKQKADLDADKGISASTRNALKAKLDEAEVSVRKAAEARQDLVARQADWDAEDRADATRQAIRDAELANLEAQAELATSAATRTRIEREILKIKQDELIHAKGKELSRLQETGAISDPEGDKRFEAFQSGLGADRKTFDKAHENPIQAYLASIKDLNTEIQTDGVQAAQSLASGLADAIVNAKNLGDVAKNVFLQLISQILAQTLERDIIGPALAAIPFFADGTPSAPGGMAVVGERGPELVNLRKGAQVIPNHALRSIQNIQAPQVGTKAGDVHLAVYVDAAGAIPREEIERMVRSGSVQAVSAARQLARGDVAALQYNQALNR